MTPWPRTVAASAALALGGCAQLPAVPFHGDSLLEQTRAALDTRPQRIELAPAARPNLQRGDTFVFGRSTISRVSAASAQSLTWTLADGRSLRGTRDFFVPPLAADYPGRRVQSTISGQPASLWPLAAGKRVSFEETRRTTWTETGYVATVHRRWDCEVVDARVSFVPAGDFAAWHVRCNAYAPNFPLPLQTITWDYAPSLGHYVRRSWFEERRQRVAMLSAALPRGVATPARIEAVLARLAAE
ncbi:hypothetical protein [Thauera sp.]|uniref:hypothetical protein n=1 Tax=Thauera sp. TaxID=1905334 RepID=UPI002C68FCBC|nr:hypothetical protein [Thauera sp.]HRP25608.1 hypothetical protein [Thauera sp.]